MTIEFEVKHKGEMYKCLIDDIDADLLKDKWCINWKKGKYTGYVVRNSPRPRTDGRMKQMHRVIMERILGRKIESSVKVDHKDLNGLNNTRFNLRIASNSQNVGNSRTRKTNKLGIKGVTQRGRRFYAQIKINGKRCDLGHFDTIEEARDAYLAAARQHFGEFARGE